MPLHSVRKQAPLRPRFTVNKGKFLKPGFADFLCNEMCGTGVFPREYMSGNGIRWLKSSEGALAPAKTFPQSRHRKLFETARKLLTY